MRTANTFGVQFMIRVDKLKEGKVPVYARITVNNERIHIALKQWVEIHCWDNRRGCGKGTKDEMKSLNNYLEEVRVLHGKDVTAYDLSRFCLLVTYC